MKTKNIQFEYYDLKQCTFCRPHKFREMIYLSTYEIGFSPNPLIVLLLCCWMYIPDLPWSTYGTRWGQWWQRQWQMDVLICGFCMYLLWGGACGWHTNAQLQNKYINHRSTVENWRNGNWYTQTPCGNHMKNVECEKSEFCHLPSCNLSIYLKGGVSG